MENNLEKLAKLLLSNQGEPSTKLPKFSVFYNGITNIFPNGERDMPVIFNAIRTDTSLRQYTEKLRSIEDEILRAEYKKTLPYVTFSGTFRKRSNDELISHSGYLCADLDKIGSIAQIKKIQCQIAEFITPVLMFISPSGNGLKVVLKIDISQGTHDNYFTALKNFFRSQINIDIDPSCRDVSRACFICFDPDVLYFASPNTIHGGK